MGISLQAKSCAKRVDVGRLLSSVDMEMSLWHWESQASTQGSPEPLLNSFSKEGKLQWSCGAKGTILARQGDIRVSEPKRIYQMLRN